MPAQPHPVRTAGFLSRRRRRRTVAAFLLVLAAAPASTLGETIRAHGIALHGDLKYPSDFTHFDHVNPDAPRGGSVTLMGHGTFDSLNPYILKGRSPFNSPGLYAYGITELNETLLVGTGSYSSSGDEAQSAYGLIAESLEYPPDRSWVIFNLRPEAHFHDGTPITADDVVFSYNVLLEHGHPRFRNIYRNVAAVEKLGRLQVKFTFSGEDNRMMPLRAGELPVMSKRHWEGRDFSRASLEPPLLSGPYRVSAVKPGHSVTFERVRDFWGRDLPVYRGRYNFDRVHVDFYRDLTVALEAFKSGAYDVHLEYISRNWKSAYDHPAVRDGRIVKEEIPHQVAQGSQAFFFNTRREKFKDRRVREALGYLFDYEWTNRNIFSDAYTRSQTYFPNSELAARGLPSAGELAILAPYREQLPEELFTREFKLPVTDGSGQIRKNQRAALRLLRAAGWELTDGRMVHTVSGRPFEIEMLIYQASTARVVQPWRKNLERVGIRMDIRTVDTTQFKQRLDNFDFDITIYSLPQSLSPGYEQREYFHSSTADIKGQRNLVGVRHPVVDRLVDLVISAPDRPSLVTRVRALDRVLLWEHYSIPHWHIGYHRIAYWNRFERPAVQPKYNLGFENWWLKDTERK